MAKKQLLEGYKRRGKRFVPPMKQMPNVHESSFIDDALPELIWLGLIHERKSYRFGAKVLEVVLAALGDDLSEEQKKSNFAMQSSYRTLSEEQKEAVVASLREASLLEDVQQAIAPLVLLYDGSALAFLGPPPYAESKETLVERLKQCVGNHLDRYDTPATVLLGSLLLTLLVQGKLYFAEHIDVPDFNVAITDPDTEEGKRAASFMRASAMAQFGLLDPSSAWPQYFWDQNALLSACEPHNFESEHG